MSTELTKSTLSVAGMIALLVAPLAAAVSVLVETTISEQGADLTAAYTDHRGAMIAGLTVNTIALAVLVGGIVWIATTLAPRARGLAVVGGILGVGGSLLIMFENGLSASAPILVATLDPAQATDALDAVKSSVAMGTLQPFTLLGGIGIALLGVAAGRLGSAWWAVAGVIVGAIGQGVGFATASRPVTVVAFVVLFLGWACTLRTLRLGDEAGARSEAAPAARHGATPTPA